MLDHLPRFKEFFNPRVNRILKEMQQPTQTDH